MIEIAILIVEILHLIVSVVRAVKGSRQENRRSPAGWHPKNPEHG